MNRLKTQIGDVIETVRLQSSGTWEGQRLAVELTNQDCCDHADLLIAQGNWQIRESECPMGEVTK